MRKYTWIEDIQDMHHKNKVHEWIETATPSQKTELMKLRMRMLTEEFAETMDAYLLCDEEEMIDGLIDLCVIAIGTLDIAEVDIQDAWRKIYRANMKKKPGIKPGRTNPHNLPDLVKPFDWEAPDHSANHGRLKDFL